MEEENIYKDAQIVVIDDVETMLNSVKNSLEFEDMNVVTFSNPLEGLEYLKGNKADVLLLDFFMPQMNGDEFVKELRKYNQETIVILQTGYSDKIPPLQMIDKMNIQGYLDKNKGEDELLLMTKAAVKTSALNKKIIEQNNQILAHEYKEEFLGKFFNMIFGEIKEKSMAQMGMLAVLEDTGLNKEDHDKCITNLRNEIRDVNNLLDSIDIEREKISTNELKELLDTLLHFTCSYNSVKLNINLSEDKTIKSEAKNIIYILADLIDSLIVQSIKEININIKSDEDNTLIEIENQVSNEELDKLNRLAKFDKNINIDSKEKLTIKC